MSTGPCDCVVLRERVRVLEEALTKQIDWLKDGDGAWHVHAKMQADDLEQALHPTSKGEGTGCWEER